MTSEMWFGAATDDHGFNVGDTILHNVHPAERCAGQRCVLHNPSDHHMRSWPALWRSDRGLMERTCPHGVGHPDPDDLDYHVRNGRGWQGVHGCDGCCRGNESDEMPAE